MDDDRDDEIRSWAGGGNWNNDPPDAGEPPPPSPPRKPPAPKPIPPPDFGYLERRGKTGLVCGRFDPLHRGHELLIDFAASSVERLTILVFSTFSDAVPADLRVRWLRERFPNATVPDAVARTQPDPTAPDFAVAFAEAVSANVKEKPSYFFSSDATGMHAALALGATFVPVDPSRVLVPTSGDAIRKNVIQEFEYLSPTARPWFVRRIAVVGPESTGKSALCKQLATDYRTGYVSEYLRTLLGGRAAGLTADVVQLAARGQIAAEDALARQAGHVMFCDTDVRTVRGWSRRLFHGHAPAWLDSEVTSRPYDLTLLLSPDVPFVGAKERDRPKERADFHTALREELVQDNIPFVAIRGSWETRLEAARRAVYEALSKPRFFSARGNTFF